MRLPVSLLTLPLLAACATDAQPPAPSAGAPRTYTLADGTAVHQKVFRLATVRVGNRAMANVTASVGAPRSRVLLGQSFLRRLAAWKIDNVQNALELEFSGPP